MKQILFFGLKEDLIPMLELVERKGCLKYVLTGNFLKIDIKDGVRAYDTGTEIPNLGKATGDQISTCDSYLVCEQETPIEFYVAGSSGERLVINQLVNPDSVEFIPAGAFNDDIILSGRVATASDSEVSQALMRRFSNEIKKTFTKVQAYYVGPKALSLLKNGKRLACASVQSPDDFDLKLPGV